MRVHLFGGGIDELRDVFGDETPEYIEVTRVKAPSVVLFTYPDSAPIFERLIFKHIGGGLVADLYLLEAEQQ